MTMTDEQRIEFFNRLESKVYVNLRENSSGMMSWTCYGDLRFTWEILKKMRISKSVSQDFVGRLRDNGGHCDCEVVLNAKVPILKSCINCGENINNNKKVKVGN